MAFLLCEIRDGANAPNPRRTIGGVPFKALPEAVAYAAALSSTYPKFGFDKKSGRWWARDAAGARREFAVIDETGAEIRDRSSEVGSASTSGARSLDFLFPRALTTGRSFRFGFG